MTTRAIRGWSLGTPISITERKKNPSLKCGCKFNTPYLHSLVLVEHHWAGPVESNEDLVSETLDDRNMQRMTRTRSGLLVPRRSRRLSVDEGAGFFSYKPNYLHRMSKWDEVDVLGIVRLLGQIAEHVGGYRSDKIVIERLWVLWRISAMRMSKKKVKTFLEETYHCSVSIVDTDKVDSFTEWMRKEDIEYLLELPEE